MTKRHVLTLDLHDDPALIADYERHHAPGGAWPEIEASIRNAGVEDMRIFREGTRLVMIMDVADDFSFERKAAADAENPVVQRWERLMEQFQKPSAGSSVDEKWRPMAEIFRLGW